MNTPAKAHTLPFWFQLRWNLVLSYVGIAVLPVILVMGIALLRARESLSLQVFQKLEAVTDLKKDQLNAWLTGAQTALEQIVAPSSIENQFLAFANVAVDDPEFLQAQADLNTLLLNVVKTNPVFKEISFYRPDGVIVAASNPVQLGKRVTFQPYFEPSLLGDYIQTPYYAVGSNELVMYITHGLTDQAGQNIAGVLAGQLDIGVLSTIMTNRVGLGNTGESYLVSLESNYFLTPSRFEADGYVQTRSYHSEGIDRALNGERGFGIYPDYRSPGVPVLGVYDWLPEMQAAILVEIEEAEGLAGFIETRNTYLLVALLGATIASVAGFYTANLISNPISKLTTSALDIARGNFDQHVEISSRNEIGILANTFNQMTRQIRDFLNSLEVRVADRTKALLTSAEVSRRLSNILDPNELVLQVVEQVQAAFNYYHAHIYLLDETNQVLKLAGGTGEAGRILLERGHSIPIERGLVGRAARTRSPVWVPDTIQEEGWLPNPLLPETKAEIAMPIIVGNKVLGVLDVQNNVANSLTQDDVDLLQAIANQVGVGLQIARQYEQTQTLFNASQTLAVADSYQEILDVFMTYAAPHADRGGLLIFNHGAEDQIIAADYMAAWPHHLDTVQPVEIGTRFAPEQIPFTSMLREGQPLIVTDLHANQPTVTPEIAEVLTQFGVQSLIGFPLILGGKLLGAVLFGYTQPYPFTESELRPVEAIANQVTILLRNQQLFGETQAALAQLDIINRRLTGEGWREYAKLSGGLVVEDIAPGLNPDQLAMSQQNGHAGQLVEITAPISVRGQEIGRFSLHHDPTASFTEEDLELLQVVADEVAVALENIRLLEQTQQNAVALEESRNLLDSVVENLPLLLFVKEAKELRYVRWNKAGESMLGISASEVMGKNAYDSFTKEEADRFTAQDWKILSGEKFLDIEEETVETPRGTRILHTRKTPVFGPDGQARYLVGLSEDITERKQAEKALQDLEALYRRAIASADSVPYSRRYADESFSFVGEGITQLTGYTPEEFTVPLFDSIILETKVYSAGDLSHTNAVRLTRAGKLSHWKADYRIRNRDGEERWLADSSIEIFGPDGNSTGSVGILTDITDRKRAEEALSRQLTEMENLNAIGQIITAQKDLNTLVNLTGEKICETFKVDTGYIALYDQRSELMRIPFYLDFGRRIDIEPKPLGVGLASRVVHTRQTLLISEMNKEVAEQLGAYIVDNQVPASWLGVPILSGDDVIGVISVQHPTQPHWFKESDVRLLNTIAANLSTAIQNIRLLEQTRATLVELEQLTRRLTRESWEGYLENLAAEMGYVYDLNQVAPIHEEPEKNGGVACEKSLVVQGEPIGRLVIADAETLDEEAEELLTAISVQLSAHIENLRLLEETEQGRIQLDKRAAELSTVAEVSTTTATELNPDELLHKVVNLTKTSFGLYHAHIYLVNEQDNTLVLAAGAGDIGMQMVAEGRVIPIEWEQSLVARVARIRTGVVVNDVRAEPDFLPHPLLPETRAELAVPLIVGNTVLGVLDVQSNQVNYFSEEDLRIQTTLASQVAVALQNARLYVEQAATVQRLRELDHLKSSFLANMSHELRTPLNSIIGFTEIILEGIDGPLTDYMEGDLKIIQKNGKHLLSLINDVLDMAKIEAGRMNLSYERFMLNELLEDVVDITSSLAQDKQLYLKIENEDGVETELLADRIRLRQVLINVVGNAIKFTESGGVTLRSQKKNGKLWLKVIDTGIGIPPEKLETIFDHFSQVDTSTTRKAGGTGLGLPISRRLMELHQGQLFAESSGIEGQGTTFNLVLPLDPTPVPQPQG